MQEAEVAAEEFLGETQDEWEEYLADEEQRAAKAEEEAFDPWTQPTEDLWRQPYVAAKMAIPKWTPWSF